MSLTNIESVRLKTSDKPVFQRDEFHGDGTTKTWRLPAFPVLATPPPEVRKNGSLLVLTADYTLDLSSGLLTLVTAPAIGDTLQVDSTSVVFTDIEVQGFLDASADNVYLASAHMLMSWAVDAARLAQKETRSGGAGFGLVTLDTSVRARELRLSAQGYLDLYQTFEGRMVPADGLTEPSWTSQTASRQRVVGVLRDWFDLNPH